jgi:hypothetical protein
MTTYKCFNCSKRANSRSFFELWGYVQEDQQYWNAQCDEKSHLTCSNCVDKYIDAKAYKALETEKKAEAQARANREQQNIFVVQTARGLLVRSQSELYTYHLTDSLIVVQTATPEKPYHVKCMVGEHVAMQDEFRDEEVAIRYATSQIGAWTNNTPNKKMTQFTKILVNDTVIYLQPEMVTARYQLTISDMSDEDVTKIVNKLDELSEGVSVGSACIYGYFNDGLDAAAASVGIENTAYCKTYIREGDFNITSLAEYKQQQETPEYHYTGTPQQQIGGNGPIIGSTWSTAHDNPNEPGYIKLTTGPLPDSPMPETRATCQVCGRQIKAASGLIAHHGYNRPGYGWQTASCPGARYLPYEQSCDRLKEIIEDIKRFVSREQEAQADFLANPPTSITVYERVSAWKSDEKREYERPRTFDPNNYYGSIPRTYENAYRNRKYSYESTIKAAKSDLATMQKRLTEWKAPTSVN